MKITVETIDPKRAAAILTKSEGARQRALSEQRVARLAKAIENGQWKVTHQGIALDDEGVLVDGQHRLHAIVRAGIPVELTVARGVEAETFDVIDTGVARTTAAALQIAGYVNTNILASAARLVLAWGRVEGTTDSWHEALRSFTSTDVLALVESERGSRLLAAGPVAEHVSHAFGRYGARSWMQAAVLIVSEGPVGPSAVEEFWEGLSSGANLAPDSPLLVFRRWMTVDTGYYRAPKATRSPLALAITIKALNRWTSGRGTSVLSFRIGIERYPFVLPVGSDPVE